jgi:enoyl-CoA hydratase
VAESLITCTGAGEVAVVTLARPEKLNALTPAMLDELEALARRIEADSAVRAVVLTGGSARAFCVGADIHEWAALQPLDMWRRWVRRGHQVFDQWARLRQPVIVSINGHALGGGLELAIVGDIRVAAASAQFALPEASIGTCPGWSGTQRLVQLVGASRAKYLAISGRRMTAPDALACGLVHEVQPADGLQERVLEMAREVAAKSPVALQLTKQLINAAAGEDSAATLEAMAGALAATTEDGAEGIASFREKRAPVYRGR